jgi:hypothetical protein
MTSIYRGMDRAALAPRLEQIGDKCSKQVDDRKHRIG